MEQNIITKPVICNWIVLIVPLVDIPVIRKLLRAKHQNTAIAAFKILDYRQRGKSLSKPHAVRQNTAVVFFELVDYRKTSILLEVIELVPDCALLKSCGFFRQDIFADVVQKFPKNIVKRNKINKLRRILRVRACYVFKHLLGNILHNVFILPELLKELQKASAHRGLHFCDGKSGIVSFLNAQLNRRKFFYRIVSSPVNIHKAGHILLR